MRPTSRSVCGYSLIELLVVIVIVGILSIVGVTMLGSKPAGSVRGIMDELEGVLASAHKRAVATGQDVVITTTGDWAVPNVMTMTFTGASAADGFTLAFGTNSSGTPDKILREHLHGGVVTAAQAGWWTTALGSGTSLDSVEPFNDANTGFQVAGASILQNSALNLFRGGATAGTVRISGTNKRFTTTVWIEVVGLTNGLPIPGGPMGALVVQANGATIYKFYNPGKSSGGTWRRI